MKQQKKKQSGRQKQKLKTISGYKYNITNKRIHKYVC